MPLPALLLVLLAAALHATWNVVAKRASSDENFVPLVALACSVMWAPVVAPMAWRDLPGWGAVTLGVALLSGAIHLVYFQTLLRGYREADLTVVYPVARGSGPVLGALGAVVVLKESLGWLGALGLALIAGGVTLLATGSRGAAGEAGAPGSAARRRAGVRWGLATGAVIALFTVLDGWAVKTLAVAPLLYDYVGNLLRLPATLPAALRRGTMRASWREHWRAVLLVGAISPLGYVLMLHAAQLAPLSRVAPAREVSMLLAALLAGRLLAEGDRLRRLAGAACVACGVVALAW